MRVHDAKLGWTFWILDGRNRTIVVAESLARVLVAIGIASVCWRSYLPPKTQKLVLTDPAFVVLRFGIARLAFTRLTFVPRGIAEWHARVDRVRWTLAIGNWWLCPLSFGYFGVFFENIHLPWVGDWDRGVQNVPNARGRRGNSPRKLPLENLDFWPPKWRFSIESL